MLSIIVKRCFILVVEEVMAPCISSLEHFGKLCISVLNFTFLFWVESVMFCEHAAIFAFNIFFAFNAFVLMTVDIDSGATVLL